MGAREVLTKEIASFISTKNVEALANCFGGCICAAEEDIINDGPLDFIYDVEFSDLKPYFEKYDFKGNDMEEIMEEVARLLNLCIPPEDEPFYKAIADYVVNNQEQFLYLPMQLADFVKNNSGTLPVEQILMYDFYRDWDELNRF